MSNGTLWIIEVYNATTEKWYPCFMGEGCIHNKRNEARDALKIKKSLGVINLRIRKYTRDDFHP